MTLKIHAKFEEKLICCFKNDPNLVNFDLSTQNCQNFQFDWFFCERYLTFDLKKCRGVIFHGTEKLRKIWRGIVLSFQNWHEEFDEFSPEYSKVSKICPLMGSFWTSVWVKKILRSYVWWHWRLIQNLKGNWLMFSRMTWETWQIFTGWKIAISF